MTHFCNHCENFDDPVSLISGISIPFPVTDEIQIQVHLHRECAAAWSKDFNVPLPTQTNSLGAD